MSGTLTRPDWAADIKDLARRLGILERRQTSRVATPAATPTHTHDGSGSASTVVGGDAEAGAAAPVASGTRSIAMGDYAQADHDDTIAIGAGNDATDSARASQTKAMAFGKNASAFGNSAAAFGVNAEAGGSHGFAFGVSASAAGTNASAFGNGANASGASGTAMGGASASGSASTAAGNGATATATGATGLGASAHATHSDAVALGSNVSTTASDQVNTGTKRAYLGAPNSPASAGDLVSGQITFWLDQSGNFLTFQVKYSTGTVKTGTVALV